MKKIKIIYTNLQNKSILQKTIYSIMLVKMKKELQNLSNNKNKKKTTFHILLLYQTIDRADWAQ